MTDALIEMFGKKVGYSEKEVDLFHQEGHRTRHVKRLSKAAGLYAIEAEVVNSRHCNSGHVKGQKLVLDIDGNFISRLCPKRMCVYLISQMIVPVALVNERLSEGHDPGDFHSMRPVRCLDTGVECLGYGEVMLQIKVVPRI